MGTFGDNSFSFGALGVVFYNTWWIILPLILYALFDALWGDFAFVYSKDSWASKFQFTVLEVIPPRELEKGPKPFESIYAGLSGVFTSYDTFTKWTMGALAQDRFSLELVGEEGKVHYYIRTHKKYRHLVESQIYAHYPEAQIFEVEDYYNKYPKIVPNRDWDLWGTDFVFAHPEPYYPIKTYDRFQEDFTGEMVDPMASIIESLGSLGPGQNTWLQLVISPISEPDTVKAGKVLMDKLTGREAPAKMGHFDHIKDVFSNAFSALFGGEIAFKTAAKKEVLPIDQRLTPVERDIYKAVQENISRNNFTTKMRMIYIGKRQGFDKTNLSSFIGAIKQFNDFNMNQFKPEDISKTYGKIFFKEGIAAMRKRKIYDRYRRRNMDGDNIILSTKELATIFHFPHMSVKSPAITQISSKLGAAPPNLPVQ
ncbi:MAG: hypothetical protein HGB08_03825 [Candidatus Moranbacteria bacterium]|nr:hypothetical protein [Candidatus Moranbacteria bacterium]